MAILPDGGAVGAARSQIADLGVPEQEPWRSTVVDREPGGWVVRTWTQVPRHLPRPVGPPDFVHHVEPALDGVRVLQVHPVPRAAPGPS